ncbi:alpha/beta fold hydrolase [Castellaniella sp.]|uniref:alpha/beta fold hydrolase n=1 Tax=Castellaniella sp. TaxID=1955812 RepID=UPI002AFEA0F4|nr:alpha/beta fold hydrolase [Castellaniella sp.]
MSIRSLPLVTLLASLILAGCSDGSGSSDSPPAPQDPLAVYKNQTVQWHDCNAYFSPNDPNPNKAYEFQIATDLGQRLQCADIQAPLDYAHPDQAQISLAMMRVQATDSPASKPNLFFNPGGPGVDGQTLAMQYAYILDNGSEATLLGQKYQEMAQSYNFVGFSPRGVGGSTRQICAGNELVYQTDPTRWGNTPENIQKLTNEARYTATNCQKNPISDFINTDATARDMDLMRHLLGDTQLHYFGISYGTWLGFWYAGIFPDRIGPMVLDSNMDFSQAMADASILYKKGQILSFMDFVAPYMARHDDILGMGKTAPEVIAHVQSLGHEATAALLGLGVGFRVEPAEIPAYIAALKLMTITQDMLAQGMPLDDIQQALAAVPPIADPAIDETFRDMIDPAVQQIEARRSPLFYTTSDFFALDNSDSVWNTVVCNDEAMPNGQDQAYWTQTALDLAARVPIISNSLIEQPCLHWMRPANITKPSIDSLKDAPLLMLQSQYDVPTPLEGALRTFDQLPATKMVQVNNEGTHGLMIYETECVDLPVMDYLLGTPPAQRLTTCPGKPLTLDQQHSQLQKAQMPAPSNFKNPVLVEAVIKQLRQSIR